jgi:hypothetical protein
MTDAKNEVLSFSPSGYSQVEIIAVREVPDEAKALMNLLIAVAADPQVRKDIFSNDAAARTRRLDEFGVVGAARTEFEKGQITDTNLRNILAYDTQSSDPFTSSIVFRKK